MITQAKQEKAGKLFAAIDVSNMMVGDLPIWPVDECGNVLQDLTEWMTIKNRAPPDPYYLKTRKVSLSYILKNPAKSIQPQLDFGNTASSPVGTDNPFMTKQMRLRIEEHNPSAIRHDDSYVNRVQSINRSTKDDEGYYSVLPDILKNVHQGERILFIGPGMGFEMLDILEKRPDLIIDSVGLEDLMNDPRVPEELAVTYGNDSKKKAALLEDLRKRFILFDINYGLPYPDGTYNAVIMGQVVMRYIENQAGLVEDIYRVLRNDCKALVEINYMSKFLVYDAEYPTFFSDSLVNSAGIFQLPTPASLIIQKNVAKAGEYIALPLKIFKRRYGSTTYEKKDIESLFVSSPVELEEIRIAGELSNFVLTYYETSGARFDTGSRLSEWFAYSEKNPRLNGSSVPNPISQLQYKLDAVCLARFDRKILDRLEKVAWIDTQDGKNDTQVLVCRSTGSDSFAKNLYIVFRGTQLSNSKQWRLDTDYPQVSPFWLKEYSRIKVHRGFLNGYQAVAKDLIEICKKEEPARIIVTGHSLGGALAELCVAHLEWLRQQKVFEHYRKFLITGYAYANPRVGNPDWKKYFESLPCTFFYFINRADIVPCVPFESMITLGYGSNNGHQRKKVERLTFCHAGKEIIIDDYPENPFSRKFINFIIHKAKPHWPLTYIRNLDRWLIGTKGFFLLIIAAVAMLFLVSCQPSNLQNKNMQQQKANTQTGVEIRSPIQGLLERLNNEPDVKQKIEIIEEIDRMVPDLITSEREKAGDVLIKSYDEKSSVELKKVIVRVAANIAEDQAFLDALLKWYVRESDKELKRDIIRTICDRVMLYIAVSDDILIKLYAGERDKDLKKRAHADSISESRTARSSRRKYLA